MVRQEGPGVDGEGAALRQDGQASHEVGPVHVICEDDAAFESQHHHMVERIGRIQAGLPGHGAEKGRKKRI